MIVMKCEERVCVCVCVCVCEREREVSRRKLLQSNIMIICLILLLPICKAPASVLDSVTGRHDRAIA
jgi:hypothetical protein